MRSKKCVWTSVEVVGFFQVIIMKVFQSSSYRRDDETGTALIELALCIPLLVTMFVGIFELSSWLNQYLAVSRLAYEGARYASTVPALQDNSESSTVRDVMNRIEHLKVQYSLPATTTSQLTRTEGVENSVLLTVSAPHQFTLLPMSSTVNVKVKMAYLYR